MRNRLNLAKRPFVDTRPADLAIAVLGLAVLVLTVVSVRKVRSSTGESQQNQKAIVSLRREVDALERERQTVESGLARFDVKELSASVRNVNAIAGLRSFSWTRFLTRLEHTLAPEFRVASIALQRLDAKPDASVSSGAESVAESGMKVQLILLSRDPEGLPKAIRSFYASPYFDDPVPHMEETPEKGKGDAWRMVIDVQYFDEGKAQ